MTIARIRRLVLKIVTALGPEADAPSTPEPVHPATTPEHTGTQVHNDRLPLATEMAAPSFMILSTRPRPRQ
ncbi:hypothetical protein ACFXKW_05620 [Streptomyces sp. NPDC059193]|uniref:hypothetical protein n=1 Tax=Streptomyces sp. NPDC059193 TaxID=3346763 RepID=UPI0036A1F7CA